MHQIKGLLVFFGLISVVAVASAEFEGGFAFAQSTYDQLNQYLKSIKYSDPEAAIGELTKLLQEEEEKAKTPLTFNRLRIKALRQIIALAEVAHQASCDENALAIVVKNEQAVGGISSKIDILGERLRPIDDVVVYFSLEHAKVCQNAYPDLLKAKMDTLDKGKLSQIQHLLQGVVDAQIENEKAKDPEAKATNSQALYVALIKRRHLFSAKQDAPLIYKALKDVTKNNSENQYLGFGEDEHLDLRYLHDQSAKHLLKKYLIQSCDYFVKALGREAVEPALHDLKLYPQITDEKFDFYKSLALYELCANIITSPSVLIKSVEHLAEM